MELLTYVSDIEFINLYTTSQIHCYENQFQLHTNVRFHEEIIPNESSRYLYGHLDIKLSL